MTPENEEEKRDVNDPLIADFDKAVELRQNNWDKSPVELPSGNVIHNPVVKRVASASEWAEKQVRRSAAAGQDWLNGVKNPSRDPIAAAIDAKEKWKNRLQEAMDSGKWEKNLAKSSAAEIAQIAEQVGADGYRKGVQAREGKIGRVVNELQPLVQAVSDTIQGMPDATDSDREARLLAGRKLMIQVGKKRAGV